MELENTLKSIFVRFGRFRWIRVDMATYLDVSGKIWLTLSALVGIGWIWLDFGADTCGFLSWILLVIARFRWIIKGFEWI